ncbi:GIY-YIG nuclease family protein [Micromonospora sp. NPDC049900]|uniref:GIY-YIG nuclease family protein n=1 Tax=Micromonospora sp. NPDC049900 TaxID=3364275 RepID=UPI0037A064AD
MGEAVNGRIDRLLRDYPFGPIKQVMTDPDYPPEQPHCGPGVYFMVAYPDRFSDATPDRIKIGRATDVRRRLADLQAGNAGHLHLAHVIHEPDADRRRDLERRLHDRFAHLRVNGEWFHWTGDLYEYVNTRCCEECHH